MAIPIWEISITDVPLEFPGHSSDSDSGGVLDFWGRVRGLEDGRQIEGIDYEAHRAMAEHQMNLLGEKAKVDFALTGLMVRHRIGFVPTGEASLFLRVASSHRAEAFAASEWLIAELKTKVPIWKRPVFRDARIGRSARQLEEAASR